MATSASAAVVKRYEELGLAEALSRPYDYPTACAELGLILRSAYARLPKPLHSLLLRDLLSAFRRLPDVETSRGISSANLLLQAAEIALPKQKKTLVVSEFKHAMVAYKRRSKAQQDGVCFFCRAWNSAANDDTLWQLQYYHLFGNDDNICKNKELSLKIPKDEREVLQQSAAIGPQTNVTWREAFKRKYIGNSSWRFTSNRALCKHCKSIIWLSGMACASSHHCPKVRDVFVKLKPISPCKVVDFLLDESVLDLSSSESDESDSDGSTGLLKLWSYPRLTNTGKSSP